VRDGKFHALHTAIVDWLTLGQRCQVETEVDAAAPAATFEGRSRCSRCRAMARTRKLPSLPKLPTCMRRTWHYFVRGLLSSVAKDYLELRGVDGVVLTYATEMRQFVGKYMDVLQRDKGAAVMQLALQQPDASAVFCAAASQRSSEQPTRALEWRNKSQEKDACFGPHKNAVSSVGRLHTHRLRLRQLIFLNDAESQELIE
jgi:hypothetical protein